MDKKKHQLRRRYETRSKSVDSRSTKTFNYADYEIAISPKRTRKQKIVKRNSNLSTVQETNSETSIIPSTSRQSFQLTSTPIINARTLLESLDSGNFTFIDPNFPDTIRRITISSIVRDSLRRSTRISNLNPQIERITNTTMSGENLNQNADQNPPITNNNNTNQSFNNQTIRIKDFITTIPEFDGEHKKLDKFLNICTRTYNLIPQEQYDQFLEIIKMKLVDEAYDALQPLDYYYNWEDLKDAIESKFRKRLSVEAAMAELSRIRQNPSETIEAYGKRVRQGLEHLNAASKSMTGGIEGAHACLLQNERTAKRHFILNLRDFPLRDKVDNANARNLSDAITIALEKQADLQEIRERFCNNCNRKGHFQTECLRQQNQIQNQNTQRNFNNNQRFNRNFNNFQRSPTFNRYPNNRFNQRGNQNFNQNQNWQQNQNSNWQNSNQNWQQNQSQNWQQQNQTNFQNNPSRYNQNQIQNPNQNTNQNQNFNQNQNYYNNRQNQNNYRGNIRRNFNNNQRPNNNNNNNNNGNSYNNQRSNENNQNINVAQQIEEENVSLVQDIQNCQIHSKN